MSNPKVSICIPSYNHAQFLPAAIESVLAQTYRSFEIVIVDDGSTDDSLKIAAAYAARHPDLIRVLTHPGNLNLGIGKTSNLARRSAKGEFWAGLPSDDVLYPDKLERQVAFLENNPDVGWVYGYAEIIDEKGRPRPDSTPFGEDITRTPNPLEKLIEGNVIPAMTILARRAYLEEIGGEDETLLYSDWDYWIRLLAHSKVAFMDRPLAGFRLHGQNTSEGVESRENLERGLAVMRSLRARASSFKNALALPRTQALLDLQLSFHFFYLGNDAAAEQSLRSAFRTDRTLARDSRFFSRWMRARVLEGIYRFPAASGQLSFTAWVVRQLPSLAAPRLTPSASAAFRAQTAIEKVQGHRVAAFAMALKCLAQDPEWIKDRALRSALLESLLGAKMVAGLRRIKLLTKSAS